jgi:hypothetical protein
MILYFIGFYPANLHKKSVQAGTLRYKLSDKGQKNSRLHNGHAGG